MTARGPAGLYRARSLLLVLLGAVILALWHPGSRGQVGTAVEGRLLDLRFALRGPLPQPTGVAIIAFDDAAVSALQAFPPSRTDIAATVAQAFEAGAAVVALDLLLAGPRDDDAVLADALASGATVLGVAEASATTPPPPLSDTGGFALVVGPRALAPLPALGPTAGLLGNAALGHVTVHHERDGMLRRMRPALTLRTQAGEMTVPGLAIAAVSAGRTPPDLIVSAGFAGGRLEGPWPPAKLDVQDALPLDFYGPEGTVETYSAADLSQADLQGRIVFIGATATGFGDRHATSFDATLPGVEAHATLAANLLEGRVLRRDPVALVLGGVLAVCAAMAGLWAGGIAHRWHALAAATALTATLCAVLQVAFAAGWWLDATTVLAALLLGLATGSTRRFLETRRRAANLARYQSPRLVEVMASDADPLGRRAPQRAVVLFVDVAGFTTRAERIGPAATAGFLRAFHERVEAAAEPLGGTILDFSGDGVLVVFGLPEPAAGDATRALEFVATLFAPTGWDGINMRAGGHAGMVQFSVLGGARHRIVSVSGDVVNTASRLQEFAKTHGASLALSEDLIASEDTARIWAEAAGLTPLADQALRGRAATQTIWIGEVPQTGDAGAPDVGLT
ncbi:adenylate/guanylate cyclase domain-containing protein [Sulfitobacter sp. HNIBRBA3233]|uniref:CHASE2 domain-containing protein n=1 Tax=Sulfitobacter marinivivus TaxID=3158558 RepID=UPI0032DF37EB